MASGDHYFTSAPESDPKLKPLVVRLVDEPYELTTARGIFSPQRIDTGTQVLLANTPVPPPSGDLLDVGCGWGPIALTLAIQSPHATVWAVDVNERALDLVRRNAKKIGLTNVVACLPDEIPVDKTFTAIWSNPPIRVGKSELHRLLLNWLARLELESDAWLVVQRNLGSDSLHRWLQTALGDDFRTMRTATGKGYRVLRTHRLA